MMSELILSALRESPLLVGDLPEAMAFDRSSLTLPSQPAPLSFDQKLGHLYEDGFAQLLASSERYELLEKSLQIQSDIHRTHGELDFLFRDLEHPENQLIHLELAVKFYLALESPEAPDGFLLPGPDARDNYFKKIDRLRCHQLTLIERYRDCLPVAYRAEEIDTQHLIIGCLFDHVTTNSLAKPPFLHPSARRGLWIRQAEFAEHFSSKRDVYLIPKPLWPVSLERLELEPLESFGICEPLSRCTLVKIDGESRPVFVAPDDYAGAV